MTITPNASNTNNTIMRTLGFVKENGLWYADLPEFLERGLGTKNNLLMVDGSDTFLDFLSNNGTSVTLQIATEPFVGFEGHLEKITIGMNKGLLDEIGHAPVDYGAYYHVITWKGQAFKHRLWLCPVAEWVFGCYPNTIYISIA